MDIQLTKEHAEIIAKELSRSFNVKVVAETTYKLVVDREPTETEVVLNSMGSGNNNYLNELKQLNYAGCFTHGQRIVLAHVIGVFTKRQISSAELEKCISYLTNKPNLPY